MSTKRPPDEERMNHLAVKAGDALKTQLPSGIRFLLIVEDDAAWASYGTVADLDARARAAAPPSQSRIWQPVMTLPRR